MSVLKVIELANLNVIGKMHSQAIAKASKS
jgi:hypothetical protein